MKKIASVICVVTALALISNKASAQYNQGDKLLNLGIGLNSYYSGGIPVSGIFEYGFTKEISAGGGIDYLSYHYVVPGYDYGFTSVYIGARGSYHFSELMNLNSDKVDIYGGLSLGYRTFTWHDSNIGYYNLNGNYGSGLFVGLHVGGRYYFSKRIAGFAELGALGSTNARIGVTIKW